MTWSKMKQKIHIKGNNKWGGVCGGGGREPREMREVNLGSLMITLCLQWFVTLSYLPLLFIFFFSVSQADSPVVFSDCHEQCANF